MSPVAAATVYTSPEVEWDCRTIVSYLERRPKRVHEFKDIQRDCSLSYGRVENAIKHLKTNRIIEQVHAYRYRLDTDWYKREATKIVAAEVQIDKAISEFEKEITQALDEEAAPTIMGTAQESETDTQPQQRTYFVRAPHGETDGLVEIAVADKPGLTASDYARMCDLRITQVSAALHRLKTKGRIMARGAHKPYSYHPAQAPETSQANIKVSDEDAEIMREAEERVARAQERAIADELVKKAARRQRVEEMARNLAIARGIDPKYLED
jgi:post-segregation antitoxin (ccd killing protein)